MNDIGGGLRGEFRRWELDDQEQFLNEIETLGWLIEKCKMDLKTRPK
jgi:hypothetical protein